ncbi:hypothetical protein FPRO04_08273 [Fusarium proliferatum]|nr:hypothetical protein FPRO04_08273 [Fusarium proliferatum]
MELRGLETWKSHVKSDGHVQKLQDKVHGITVSPTTTSSSKLPLPTRKIRDDFEDDDPESESDVEDDSEEDQELVATDFVPGHCLFCTKDSSTLDESMEHMSLAHGFNISFQEFLAVDLETLVSYLHFVTNTYRECICCGTRRSTVEGIRHHMLAKGHCRFDITPETEEFYEIPQYEDALGHKKQDVGDPVRLPSGRVISHRKHEEPRVPRKDTSDQKRLDSPMPVEPGMEIVHRRTVNGNREVVQANEAILAAQLSRLKVTSDRAAQRQEKRWRGSNSASGSHLRHLTAPGGKAFREADLPRMQRQAAEPVRIITMSQSQVANPAAGPRKDLSRKPRPTAYSPDMDKPRVYSLARMREIDDWKNELFFTYRSFSYNGVEVEMKTFFVKEYDEMENFLNAIDDGNIHILFALIPDRSLGINPKDLLSNCLAAKPPRILSICSTPATFVRYVKVLVSLPGSQQSQTITSSEDWDVGSMIRITVERLPATDAP